MSPEAISAIQAVLNSDDLTLGISTEDPAKPFTMSGGGERLRMTRALAEGVLIAMETEWGKDAPEAVVLRGLINPQRARSRAQGGMDKGVGSDETA